ncbi:MAG: YkgJ family cysteine cluster protein [Candidatus Hermodarchaeota archaeon]
MKEKKGRFSYTDFECIKCGECCKAGYDVYVINKDIEKWKDLDKQELLEYIFINPQCISLNNGTEFNSEDGNTIKRIWKNFKDSDKKVDELIEFIKKNHLYCGQNSLRRYVKTILPDINYDPLLAPKSFDIILKGLEFGLEYILKTDMTGKCSFLKLNLCSIYKYKPIACTRFPYTKEKCLRKDNILTIVCKGLRKVKEL